MRNRIIAVAALAVLAACGPEPQSSDPNASGPPSAASSASGAQSTSYNNLAPVPGSLTQPVPAQSARAPSSGVAAAPAPQPAAPAQVAQAAPPTGAVPAAGTAAPAVAAAAPPGCADCGVIAAITPEHREGKPGWVGTLGGGAAGGLIGNQFGRGSGNVAMTVVGVVGGALAGREVEKRVTTTTVYRIDVTMANGTSRTLTLHKAEGYTVGERVHVHHHRLVPY